MLDNPPPPTYAKMMRGYTGNVDRWQIIHFQPPGSIRLFTGAAPSAAGQGMVREKFDTLAAETPPGGFGMRNLDALTPESETSTHYFWAQTHDFDAHDQAVTDAFFEQVDTAFRQDWELFETQQRAIERNPGAPTISILVDKGPTLARRLVAELLEAERAQMALAGAKPGIGVAAE
jgi:vanillate O-demethylase monooxygenase subunit